MIAVIIGCYRCHALPEVGMQRANLVPHLVPQRWPDRLHTEELAWRHGIAPTVAPLHKADCDAIFHFWVLAV